jgi:hypothetical protein
MIMIPPDTKGHKPFPVRRFFPGKRHLQAANQAVKPDKMGNLPFEKSR